MSYEKIITGMSALTAAGSGLSFYEAATKDHSMFLETMYNAGGFIFGICAVFFFFAARTIGAETDRNLGTQR